MLSRYIRAGGCKLGALTSKAADIAGVPIHIYIYYMSSLIVHRSIGPGVCTLPLPPSSSIYYTVLDCTPLDWSMYLLPPVSTRLLLQAFHFTFLFFLTQRQRKKIEEKIIYIYFFLNNNKEEEERKKEKK